MKTSRQYLGISQSVIAFAVLAALVPAQAQDIGELTAPGTSISIGVGAATGDSKDRARFGMYNGLRDHGTNGLLGFSYLNRDNTSGKWITIEGRNLGLDSRELSFSYRNLGDLKFTADYGELVRHDPRTINTSLVGAGTTTPTVSLLATPGTGQELNLELKRKSIGFIVEKQLGNALQLEVNFKNEDKKGARFFGKGFACSTNWRDVGACSGTSASAVLMLPEPVDSTIRQLDAKLNYSGEKLRLSGGYYGSFYTNSNGTLTPTISGGFSNQNGGAQAADALLATTMGQPMALPPDSQAHQLFLAGNYTLTPKTRLNFKYAYTHATQNESFSGSGLANAPAGRSDLGGVIDTTRAQVGFSSHPLEKVHLHGDLAYESKNNKTPLAYYNSFYQCAPPAVYNSTTRSCSAAWTTGTFTNGNQSPKKYDAKLEASYKLPQQLLLTGGLRYEREDFGTIPSTEVPGGVSGLRQKMEEKGYRVELRRMMSETFTGAVSYISSRKKGVSSWLQPATLPSTGVTEVTDSRIYSRTAIFPFIYMDRQRDKVRVMGNWMPADRLSLQAFADVGSDTFSGPTEHGLRQSKMDNVSLDAAYTVSDAWKLNAYLSRGRQSVDSGHSTGYDAVLDDTAWSYGVGVAGKPSGRLQLGADLTGIEDTLAYKQTADASASAANRALLASTGGLPDVTYRLLRLKLFAEYGLNKASYLRLDLVHQRTMFNEWTYNFNGTSYLYSDNTTLNAKQSQNVTFLGVSYIYKFQ